MNNDEFYDHIDSVLAQREGAPKATDSFECLVRIIWALRQPWGCPWDREQTHASIEKHAIEEAYELVDAIEAKDVPHMQEEMGDVLEQVMLHAQIAADDQAFTIEDVVKGLHDKLIRRHPHVFGTSDRPRAGFEEAAEDEALSSDEVLDIWDEVKAQERADEPKQTGLMDSIPVALPALLRAQKISKRAAKAGFEWACVEDVWEQVAQEKQEFEAEEKGSNAAAMEFGDLLFALVNVARWEGIDAEGALRASTAKFLRRWEAMEALATKEGKELCEYDVVEQNELWQKVKAKEHRQNED